MVAIFSNIEAEKLSCALHEFNTITSSESRSAKELRTYVTNGSGMLSFDRSSQQDAAKFLQYI